MKKIYKLYSIKQIVYLFLILQLCLNAHCVMFSERTAEIKQMNIATSGVSIEAEDKTFKLTSGKSFTPPFYAFPLHGNACSTMVDPNMIFGGILFFPFTIIQHGVCLLGGWEYNLADFNSLSLPGESDNLGYKKFANRYSANWALKHGGKKVTVTLKDDSKIYHGVLMIMPVLTPDTKPNPQKFFYTIDLSQFNASEVKDGNIALFYEYIDISNVGQNRPYHNIDIYDAKKWLLWVSDTPF